MNAAGGNLARGAAFRLWPNRKHWNGETKALKEVIEEDEIGVCQGAGDSGLR